MTLIMEPAQSFVGNQEVTAGTLEKLLHAYVDLLSEGRSGQWSKDETELVREVRAVLTNVGHVPDLGLDVRAHLDSRTLDGS